MSLVRNLAHRLLSTRFAPIQSTMSRPLATDGAPDVLASSDPEQARLMAERVIRVDPQDRVVGHMSKKDSHLVANNLPLHRAFSLFLFDAHGRMLLQQRAAEKVTFPSFWTNTVCSHPLHVPLELGLDESDPVLGAKRAAIRKLGHELGVNVDDIQPADLHFLTRIHYRADSTDAANRTAADPIWGEHELDYIFFAQKDLPLQPEPNEVSNVRYVTVNELKDLFTEAKTSDQLKLTPWFCHIVEDFGWDWWQILLRDGISELRHVQDPHTIHAMGACGNHCT